MVTFSSSYICIYDVFNAGRSSFPLGVRKWGRGQTEGDKDRQVCVCRLFM